MKRVIVTGGTGKVGKWVVRDLLDHDYQVLNLDRVPLDDPRCRTLITDITDAGQVFNALASYTGLHEFDPSLRPQPIDAIVHLAAVPRILITPDNEVFRINVMGTYHIMDAATKLGIKKVVFASSETIYGLVFANEHRNPEYFPLDEEYPIDPMDSYALSKVVNERTGKAFHERSGIDIYGLRIGNVIEPHEYALFPQWFAKPDFRRRIAWSYIDARDLAQICRLAIEKDGLGFQIFNAASADTSSDLPTAELVGRYYREVPLKRKLGEYETLLANEKAVRMLGFRQDHFWRNYVNR
ncbi:MAG TPA: NAD(P)-dependent oxidoreductase [Ktedonobacteraceae bacterium]|jgi:nucleoside-diphosphate-sugar epimerase|nr:NAD(P)-dependent oxidoreductase [Ktedonobacteraceae bacterium]